MGLELNGKVAMVTGGASGIGEQVVRGLIRTGARVVIVDQNYELASSLESELGSQAKAIQVDVTQADQVERAVETIIEIFGSLNLAVNSAGVSGKRETSIEELDVEHWKRVIDINLNGTFYCLKYQLKAMKNYSKEGGAIVNMGSILSQVAVAGSSGYVASKHALVGLTKAAALENAKNNIRVNLICPGYIDTPLLATGMSKEFRASLASKHAMGRLGEPQEISELCLFLLSDKASFITGGSFTADGGYTIS